MAYFVFFFFLKNGDLRSAVKIFLADINELHSTRYIPFLSIKVCILKIFSNFKEYFSNFS